MSDYWYIYDVEDLAWCFIAPKFPRDSVFIPKDFLTNEIREAESDEQYFSSSNPNKVIPNVDRIHLTEGRRGDPDTIIPLCGKFGEKSNDKRYRYVRLSIPGMHNDNVCVDCKRIADGRIAPCAEVWFMRNTPERFGTREQTQDQAKTVEEAAILQERERVIKVFSKAIEELRQTD